jgi:RNA polymerase sigma factor (sigma-70 family)
VFPTTRWTLILSAREGGEAHRVALETLLSIYWKPVYFYLRRRGLSVEAAEDAVQGFFVHLLERDMLQRLDPARGRFRSYLLTSLDHYRINEHEKAVAVKRGGRTQILPLDTLIAERDLPGVPEDPGRAFDREWATEVMERAIGRLRREYEEGRRKGPAEVFLAFFGPDEPPSYADAAERCGLTSAQFKAALHRSRERFREIVREEVAATVGTEDDVEIEMRALFDVLQA